MPSDMNKQFLDLKVFVFSQGFAGKPGTEGPQGPVGMYVSDTSVK